MKILTLVIDGVENHRCSKCMEYKPASCFSPDKRRPLGLQSNCKLCKNGQMRKYRKENPEYTRSLFKNWLNNKPKEYKSAVYKKASIWFMNKKNSDEKYREKWRVYKRIYESNRRRSDPDYKRLCLDRDQILHETKRSPGSVTRSEWKSVCDYYNNVCVCCRKTKKLTIDHIIPISLGGNSDISNLQPLCGSCNSSKRDKIIDYRPDNGKYCESMFVREI